MTRKLVVLLAVGLVLAPAASAKGPHAVISSGPEAVEAGKPWLAKVEFNEFPRPSHPRVVASQGDRRIAARLRPDQGARFKMRMVLPTDGRWHLSVVAGKLRFAFPAVAVGSWYRATRNMSAGRRVGARRSLAVRRFRPR